MAGHGHRAPAPVRLTEARLGRPAKGRAVLSDAQVSGLRVRFNGRWWSFYYQGKREVTSDGRVVRPVTTLGPYSPVPGLGLTVREARMKALELQGKPRASAKGYTVRALAEDFLGAHYPKNARRRAKVEALLECHALPTLGAMAVGQVTREHCVALVQAAQAERRVKGPGSVRRGGRAPAEALIRTLRQLFRHAVKRGRLQTLAHSPAELLEPRDFGIEPAEPRDRGLTAEELRTLFLHKEIDLPGLLAGRPGVEFGLSVSVRAAIILGPHLAVRPAALVGLRWDEVDLSQATATIRGGRGAKQKHGTRPRDFAVPLSGTAVAVLRALERTKAGPWVFPSASAGGHLTGDVLADAMKRLSARLELPGGPVRPHDARRTFAIAAERLGFSQRVIDRVLQHSLGKVRGTYQPEHGEDWETRRKAHELVDANWTAVREGKPAAVVPINSAAGRGQRP